MSEAKKIQFQSKLYITPSDDSALEIIDDNRLCIQGKYGFFSVDISDVKKPKILKNMPCSIRKDEDANEKRLREKWGNYQGIVYSSDKKTQFVFRDNHFTIVDVSVSNQDKILGDYEVFEYENHMYISDILLSKDEKYAYVINSISGVQIYDISNKYKLKALGKLKEEIGTDEIYNFYLINDRYLYGRLSDYVIIDIQDKQQPKLLKANILEGNEEIYYYNKEYLLVIEDNLCDAFTNFIKLLDIHNPLKPKFVDNVKVKDFNHGVQLLGNKVLFLGNKGLWIYTID